MNNIPVIKSSMPDFEDYCNVIRPLWDNRVLTNMGSLHKTFTENLEQYLMGGRGFVTLFVNGHLALESALQSMNLTGEVITTPFTFVSTTHAIVRNGLTPVFCDIRETDFTIDTSKLENLITENTSAIVPVHVYGHVCDLEEIKRISRKYNLKVIYDAAHAFGVRYRGTPIGCFGDASMFSFHATKVFHSIEGGAITTNDERIISDLYNLKNFGILSESEVASVGMNAKMNEFQAAMGICNLTLIDEGISKREKIFHKYLERLGKIEGLYVFCGNNNTEMNYSYCPVIVIRERFGIGRDELAIILREHNILTRKYFWPLTNEVSCYEGRFPRHSTPVAQRISRNVLTLPMFSDLTVNDVNYICDVIDSATKRTRNISTLGKPVG